MLNTFRAARRHPGLATINILYNYNTTFQLTFEILADYYKCHIRDIIASISYLYSSLHHCRLHNQFYCHTSTDLKYRLRSFGNSLPHFLVCSLLLSMQTHHFHKLKNAIGNVSIHPNYRCLFM